MNEVEMQALIAFGSFFGIVGALACLAVAVTRYSLERSARQYRRELENEEHAR